MLVAAAAPPSPPAPWIRPPCLLPSPFFLISSSRNFRSLHWGLSCLLYCAETVRKHDIFLSSSFPIKYLPLYLNVQEASEILQIKFQMMTLALGTGSIQRIDFYLPCLEQTILGEQCAHAALTSICRII